MKNLKESLGFALLLLISILCFVIALPFIILSLPFTYFNRKQFEKEYENFLEQNNGKNFFCYNNKKKLKKFLESEIIPLLNNNIDIVYLNGRRVETKYSNEFISHALYNLKSYSKFPHLMKIRNGKLIDKSVNSIFYSIMNQNKLQNTLLAEISIFFEIEENHENR